LKINLKMVSSAFSYQCLAVSPDACAKRSGLLVSFQQLSDDDWHADYEDSNKADGIILLGYGDYVDDMKKNWKKIVSAETHLSVGVPKWAIQVTIRSNNREGWPIGWRAPR
jgi:hypothetical protein